MDGAGRPAGGMSSFWRYEVKSLPEIPPEPKGYKLG
jgi:hypothetical protein